MFECLVVVRELKEGKYVLHWSTFHGIGDESWEEWQSQIKYEIVAEVGMELQCIVDPFL